MELAISTTFNFNISLPDMMAMIQDAGFHLISLSGGNYEQLGYLTSLGRETIRDLCQKYGITVDSIHAPLGPTVDISHVDSRIRESSVQIMKQAIHACTDLHCSLLILHLSNRFSDDDLSTRVVNVRQSMEELVPYARHKGVRIAVENLICPAANRLFRTTVREHTDPVVGICFDTSHAHVARELSSLLSEFGPRMLAVHISDNKGVLDDHMLPYEGSIDWPRFMNDFSRIGYSGVFLLEVEMRESMFKEPQVFLKQAYARGMKVVSLIGKEDL